ncbi:hypothetical protein [Desulfitobacterium sp.]|uniref:hypothetical protein n=1 Tax=Desulfitobacterium sp. TaxID=49981 RepID=UPI002BCF1A5E|nr:hypothetical protein [Desulfitobacterium sp.]HVJ49396.1 hypothetical protein [Desulfitobacterium sp.]
METQLTIADILNAVNEPIGVGDYVEHVTKPEEVLQVVKGPYMTVMKHTGLDVRDRKEHILPVLLKYVRRV